jgi:hypothetical protein
MDLVVRKFSGWQIVMVSQGQAWMASQEVVMLFIL